MSKREFYQNLAKNDPKKYRAIMASQEKKKKDASFSIDDVLPPRQPKSKKPRIPLQNRQSFTDKTKPKRTD